MAKIIAVCTSPAKGTKKEVVPQVVLRENYGIVGDAHASSETHRQVSLLARESIDKMRDLGLVINLGDFAENLTCEGIELVNLPVGTRLAVGSQAVLEVTQIGKECHHGCAIFRQVGRCIMPKEGVFGRVVHGGAVKTGDTIKVISPINA